MLTPDELREYAAGWKEREREKELRKESLRGQAMVKARLIAVMLREKYSVERVILFGSLAEGSIRGGSDIDLAVTGADMERYIDMYWDASELARPFPLDLVPLETASPALRNNIQGSGVEL